MALTQDYCDFVIGWHLNGSSIIIEPDNSYRVLTVVRYGVDIPTFSWDNPDDGRAAIAEAMGITDSLESGDIGLGQPLSVMGFGLEKTLKQPSATDYVNLRLGAVLPNVATWLREYGPATEDVSHTSIYRFVQDLLSAAQFAFQRVVDEPVELLRPVGATELILMLDKQPDPMLQLTLLVD